MNPIIELLSNWIPVNGGIESLVEKLIMIQRHDVTPGKLISTKNANVSLQEVPTTTKPSSDIEIGQIKWTHGSPKGAWGITRCRAVLQYMLPLAKDGSYPPILMGIQLDADITLKPKKEFNDIKDFTPLYQMLRDNYGGNKAEFCAAMATRTITEYNNFGTVDGVLYHELLHVMLAKIFAKQLQKSTLQKMSGSGYETREKAQKALLKIVDEVWKDWRGLLLHDAGFLDERFIWEKECAYYIKQYEKI
ncbi:MAG: hypothetical protein KDJ22_05065 [Candidatus Competibacteraceae bacterium]|nr:hypothetical protein [Candidatus Competibacteraceae bacterium]MCP5127132.1 hypothetical protein [Gammaproteobacteria bacterium]HRX69752.1 hypothetical protein [Candidatus Competibacteraceae bacterium]